MLRRFSHESIPISKIDTLYKEKGCHYLQRFLNFPITVAVGPGYFLFLW